MPYGSEALYRRIYYDENGIIGSITPLPQNVLDATPFTQWKRENAINAIARNVPPLHSRAQAFYDGDHWQGSWGWIGPHPNPVLDADRPMESMQMWSEIQAGFVSRNIIREIVRRFKRAVAGREPRWAFVPRDMSVLKTEEPPPPVAQPQKQPPQLQQPATALQQNLPSQQSSSPFSATDANAQQDAVQGAAQRAADRSNALAAQKSKVPPEVQNMIDEVSRAMTLWWDERGVHEMFQEIVTSLQLPAGRAGARVYIPEGLTQTVSQPDISPANGSPPSAKPAVAPPAANGQRSSRRLAGSSSLDEALAKLYPEHPKPTQSFVYEDPKTKRKCSIVVQRFSTDANSSGQEVIELTYLDSTGKNTVMTTITEGSPDQAGTVNADLGGRLLMNEVRMEPIITEQMVELQRAVNLALTMVPRNNVTSGFMSRIITNGKLPGYWETDAQGKRTGNYIVTDFPVFGAGSVNFITGQETANKDGTKTLAPVGVHETPPVDPTPTLLSYSGMYEAMLEEGEQDHILDRSASNANSGRSQEQGRAGFESANDEIATRVNRLGRWFMETTLACAEHLMGKPGFYTSKLRCVFECRTKIGPVSTAQQTAWLTAWDKGAISKETMQEAIGINDTDAENDKIDNQEGGSIDTITRQSNAFKMLTDSTLGADVAGEIVKFDPALIARITQSFHEQQAIKQQQQQAQLEAMQNVAATRANANGGDPNAPPGQQNGPGRPSGNRDPRAKQGLSKLTQKQVTPNRARPKKTP